MDKISKTAISDSIQVKVISANGDEKDINSSKLPQIIKDYLKDIKK